MGCGPSRPMTAKGSLPVRWEYQDDDTDSDEFPERIGTGSPGHRGVHWGTGKEEVLTEYGSLLPSNMGSRVTTAKGSRIRSAATRIGSALTAMTVSTMINEAEWMMDDDDEGESLTEEVELPGVRAPSLSLWYNDNDVGDILTQDVYVPKVGLAKNTYYCCLQWNAGINGGGYCGIQDHPRGRNYIFSLWDPPDPKLRTKPVYVGPGTMCEPFEGEGAGLKSWNFSVGWDPDCWYTTVLRRWGHDEHSFFGFWVKHHMEQDWTHIVTLDYPVGDVFFETLSCSFLEDWEGCGEYERRVHFQNGYKHTLNGGWMPFSAAAFSVVREIASKVYEDKYDCGVLDGTFYLQSGGDTMQTASAIDGGTLERRMPSKPDIVPMCCYLTSVTDTEVTWEIPSGGVPQFQYIVYVDRLIFKQEVDSEARICRFSKPPKELVELLVEDIYGRSVRSKFQVMVEEKRTKLRTKMDLYVPSQTNLRAKRM